MSPTDIANGLTTELLWFIIAGTFAVAWVLRTPEARSKPRGYVIGCRATMMTLIQITPSYLRNPWLWPLFLAIPVGIGMENTRWEEMVELAGGGLVIVYLCAAAFLIVKSKWR